MTCLRFAKPSSLCFRRLEVAYDPSPRPNGVRWGRCFLGLHSLIPSYLKGVP
jgi:hypothetical protein